MSGKGAAVNADAPSAKRPRSGGDARMGNAEATQNSRNSALKLYNRLMREAEEPTLEELGAEDAEADNLKIFRTIYKDRLVHGGLTKKQDDDGNEIGESYSNDTLLTERRRLWHRSKPSSAPVPSQF